MCFEDPEKNNPGNGWVRTGDKNLDAIGLNLLNQYSKYFH